MKEKQTVNILLVSRDFLFEGGAAARWGSLTRYLSEKHKIYVATRLGEKTSKPRDSNRKIQILGLQINPWLTGFPFASLINVILLVLSLSMLLARIKVDVVVVTVPEFEEGIAGAIVCRRHKKDFVIDIRDLIVEDHVRLVYSRFPEIFQKIIRRFFSKSFLWLVNSSSRAVTVTSTLKRILRSNGVRVPIDLVPNGADTTLFHALNRKEKLTLKKEMSLESNFVVLYAGALDVEYYPMDVVYRAFKTLLEALPEAKLVLCGPGNKDKLENLGENIQYLGVLGRKEVARVMQACDMGVISMDNRESTFCALTTKLFEYLASGLPVVAACPQGGEMDILITSEKVGYAVPSGDHESMAGRMLELFTSKEEYQIFAKNGSKLVSTRFNRRSLAESYSEILSEIVRSKR